MAMLDDFRTPRLDKYVVNQRPDLSRAFAAKLIERGQVLVNGEPAKPSYKIRPNDKVKIIYSESKLIPSIELPIIYEDNDCVVINKPAGLLTHSKGDFNPEATVATWLRSHYPSIPKNKNINEREGIVHRLDRGTSGVLIAAKTPEAMHWLQKQFSQRKVKKTYIAIISGTLNPSEAIIDMPIERNPKAPSTFRVGSNGKPATTQYKILKTGKNFSLAELKPETGRTHQLRVHLKHLGHPILGDTFYGGALADRLYLHAKSIEITLPNHHRESFLAPVPRKFNQKIG